MILVNGCSFSRGKNAWPHQLKTYSQDQVINLSCSSAGNTYIHESTVDALSKLKIDAALIMWSGITRVDVRVKDIEEFNGSCYTSRFASDHNDWPEKITDPINDQEFVSKDWVFGLGEPNRDPVVSKSQLFKGMYQYLDVPQFVFHFLIKMISLQNTLKSLHIPYCFMFYQSYQHELQKYSDLCKMIDWNNVYTEQNIYDLAKTNNDIDDTGHPGTMTHKIWANIVDKIIIKMLEDKDA